MGAGYTAKPRTGVRVAPPMSQGEKNVFCCGTLTDALTGALFINMTEALSVMSLEGKSYYFIVCDYDTTYIFEETV